MCAAIRRSARKLRHYAGCILIVLLFMSLTSCSRRRVCIAERAAKKPIVAVDEVAIAPIDAGFLHEENDVDIPDVPRPLKGVYCAASSWQTFTNDRLSIVARYSSNSTIAQVTDFYRQQMEFLGWELDADFKGRDDVCLVFRRPSRCCVISVHTYEQVTNLSVMYQSEFNNSVV